MKKIFKICIISLLFYFSQNSANALDVLFPQKNPYTTSSETTYIMGSVKKGSHLSINGEKTKVWHNGAFCIPIKLKSGENKFVLVEENNKTPESIIIKITKPVPKVISTEKKTYTSPKKTLYKDLMLAKVITDGAPVRSAASTNSNRITHLPINTNVLIDTQYGNWYKINVGNSKEQLWIYKDNIKFLYPVNNRIKVSIWKADFLEDNNFAYLNLNLDMPIAYKTEENENTVKLTLYGIKDIDALTAAIKTQYAFEKITTQKDENDNLTISFPSNNILWGYDANYSGNILIFQKRKPPVINPSCPLKNITVAIDAGHGGKELGTVGPTRIPEKDVNLEISKFLKAELIKRGANVVMTREQDEYPGLYERPDIANKEKSLICLSIHANSMVDGNPLERHGTSAFYYNKQAKNLADTLKNKIIKDLSLKDDGTRYASFVLTRPTMPVSVLIEVAYMPNPDEYIKLTNRHFQHKTARSIAEGLEEYLKNSQNQ